MNKRPSFPTAPKQPKKCFFNDCKKLVNSRGKFCEEHDAKELEEARSMAALMASLESSNKVEK